MPQDMALQDKFLDPADPGVRFFPLTFQDFWINMDVASTFAFIPSNRNTVYTGGWKNPVLSRQPQPYTYYQYGNAAANVNYPYSGCTVKPDAGYSQYGSWTHSYGSSDDAKWAFLSAGVTEPGLIGHSGPDKYHPYCAAVGGTNGSTGSGGWD